MAVAERQPALDLPFEGKTVKALCLLSLKRTFDVYAGNHSQKAPLDEDRCGRGTQICRVCTGSCQDRR